MKVLVLLAILYATSLLIVCFGSEGNSTKSGDDPGEAAGCLLPYRENLDRLLTLDKASETAGRPKQQAVSKYNRVMKNASYHSMQYVWKTGRQKKMKVEMAAAIRIWSKWHCKHVTLSVKKARV